MKQLIKIGKYRHWPLSLIAAVMLLCGFMPHSGRAAVTASAVVEHQRVYVGESFVLQIQVDGDDSPSKPDLSLLSDFTVTYQGGQQNNSSSVSLINGHMSRVSRHGYIFNYALIAQKAGRLTIPDLEVKADGRSYFTMPITIVAVPPQETADFKLRAGLAKNHCYVGEPVKLTYTWYIGKDVQGFDFNLPILTDDRFSVRADPDAPTTVNNDNLLTIPLGKGEVVARKGNGSLNGRDFLTVSFSRILVPLVPGKLTLPTATVSAKALSGRRRHANSYDPFNMFNDDFFGRSRNVYRTVVVPANTPVLTVLSLPQKGRPANFNGLVGDYSLLVSASPAKAKVGDPITLTIQVAGAYADNVFLPPLQEQLSPNDFKVPVEMAPGVGQGQLKTFIQTVRARHAGIKEIPSLSLSFFNSKTAKYEVARSKAVPLQISGNRIVTAQDAEGGSNTGVAKKDIHASKGGINYNYEDDGALVDQWAVNREMPGRILIAAYLGTPALLYGLWFLVIQVGRLRRRNPNLRDFRKAYGILQKTLKSLDDERDGGLNCQLLADALKKYLGAKLNLNPLALTYNDIEQILAGMGIANESLAKLKNVMEQCEAGLYAGGVINGESGNLLVTVNDVVKKLEAGIKPVNNKG